CRAAGTRIGARLRRAREHGAIQSQSFPPPPLARRAPRREVAELVSVHRRAHVPWWRRGKRIGAQQTQYRSGVLQQARQKRDEPWIPAIVAKCREPHLPVEPRLVGHAVPRGPSWVVRLHLNSYGFQVAPSSLPSTMISGRVVVITANSP